ncbi:cysteine-tryptophan domain-containing zinc finger protein 7 [Gossypium hirsutum]|uniref:Cysteine-tryptophan domain-containing zinc finger protein 7 n=1 Tax=Gossypium hirsutum TaxID=3635 RepID=A0ABM2YMU8_GOSHI|nr:cysteine-tryptophan domain-containing zinc finger protein 7-like [Gossypium hirsutum]
MISLGSNDARKGIKFAGREMEETELEEGEACSYSNNNDDYDATTDTENDLSSLSYIDEKIQHVLGHFQKDFEGGVSAENLGAKFGGYGSFLPTYTRSPGWPHPNGSPKVQSWHAPRSPPKMPLEDGRHNSVCSSSGSQSVMPGLPSNFETLRKTSTVNDSIKQEVNLTSAHVDELAFRCEFASKKAASLSDPKTLKVRIKMGSGDLSTQKNAAIYSGLGLDVSPSSSLDQSPSESEGMYQESQEPLSESPTSILRLMTSFSVPEEALLSPLPDHLLNLIVKEKKLKENRSDSRKCDGMLSRHKKAKSMEKKNSLAERTSGINREIMNGSGLMPKKEADIDLLACEELVSKTLKLPLLSNSSSASDKVKNKGTTRNKGVHDVDMEKSVEPLLAQEIGWENLSASSAQKVLEEQKTSVLDVISGNARKDGYNKADKTYDAVKANSNTLKGCKALKNESVDPSKKKISQGATLDEQDNMKLPSAEECMSSGGKRKSKDSQHRGSLAAEVPKESLRVSSSLMVRNKQTAHANSYANKRESGDKKLERPFRKAEDRYKDFFGDTGESEQEENQASSLEICSKDQLKEADNIEKSTSSIHSAHSERLSGKKTEDLLATESYPRATVDGASNSTNVNVAGTSHATAAPVMIRENWVCCDNCQKWRLLPVSINPADLPENWLIDEEETTKAVLALYHVPTVENQTNLQSNLGSIMSRLPSADALRLDQNQVSFGSHAMLTAARKKHGLKEISNAMDKDGPTPMKKMQSSVRSRNLTDMTRSSVSEEPGLHHLSKSDLPLKKHKNKWRDKHKLLEHGSVGGPPRKLRVIVYILLMKIACLSMVVWGGPSTNNGLPTALGKDQPKHSECSYNVLKSDKERQQISGKRPKDKVHPSLTDGSLDLVNCNGGEVSRKRKVDECIDGQLYTGFLQGVGNHFQDSRVFTKEDVSENEYRREKKARVSKSGGKDSSAGKSSGKLEKKSRHTKGHQTGQDLGSSLPQRSLDVPDSLKRDFGSAQLSLAATSSSSKVSGSHKSKSGTHKSKHCFNETKGSPVESVSSSPMRIANPNKLPSTRRNVAGSPRRSSDGEDGGSDRSGTVWREKTSSAPQHGSLESSIHDIQDKDHGQLDGSKAKALIESSPEVRKGHFMNGGVDYLGQENQYAGKSTIMDEYHYEEKQNDNRGNANVSHPRKSGKGSSRSKDRTRNLKSDFVDEQQDYAPLYEVKPRVGRNKFQGRPGMKFDESENRFSDNKESLGKFSGETGKRESQSNGGQSCAKADANGGQDVISTVSVKQNFVRDGSSGKYTKMFHSEKSDHAEIASERGNSVPSLRSGGTQNEMLTGCSRPVSGSQTGDRADESQGDGALKVQKQIKKSDQQNGIQHSSSRHTSGGHRIRDVDAPSPMRKDFSSQAATNALKEAKDLKHLADRFKNSGSNVESTALYFQAALKFLHSASLLESCNSDSAKHGEMIQSMQIYSCTAKLCEFCAHEYERLKDMAAASLAYKCMEVAYMRVIYSSHANANRDRHELQTALQMVPPGESPSSSASDVDNLNHPTAADKVAFPKGVNSPQVVGNHVISARNRPNFVRLLNFAQDINHAMEASRKSRTTFLAASSNSKGAECGKSISSVKKALDFNFLDVEGVLHLVRVAMEAISH